MCQPSCGKQKGENFWKGAQLCQLVLSIFFTTGLQTPSISYFISVRKNITLCSLRVQEWVTFNIRQQGHEYGSACIRTSEDAGLAGAWQTEGELNTFSWE